MPRRTKPRTSTTAETYAALMRLASPIGQLERLAGVGDTQEERAAFWLPFAGLPARESLDAGVRELRARILSRIEAGELRQV